ncbi:unnamed protein product [Ranitomeya imitator]|uniref:Neurotransmitter-gated ion-channel transmembrane domain-containing protein n=1 Tax=Ranitomeya imitator TaxID=111125 RepID=A0ABN9MLX5_9NEOB|nr:unnamed protein product [Ranitomeya imitator]
MGKTSDLTDVKKAIIDTLKQEGKTQKEISQQIGCSQSAVSRHLNGKSVGRKQCGRKRCTTRRGDRTLRKIVEKDRFQTLGNLRKQWTESGVETSRATVHRRVQEMGYRCRNGLQRSSTGLLLSGPKYFFLMKANFACHSEIKVRVILLNWCAWFLRMRKPGENRIPIPCKYTYPKHHSSMSSIEMNIVSGHQSTNGNILYCGYHNLESPCCPPTSDSGVMCGRVTCPSLEDSDLIQKKCLRECMPEITKILEEVQYIARRFRDHDEGEEICSEWKFAAAVIDRLCLVAFTLFAIICTIAILMSAPNFVEAVSKDFT